MRIGCVLLRSILQGEGHLGSLNRQPRWCSRLHNSFLDLSYFIAVNIEAFAHTPSLVAHPQLCIFVLLLKDLKDLR